MREMKKVKYLFDILDEYRKPISAEKRTQNSDVLYPYYGASGEIDKIDGYTIDDHVMLIGEDGANLRMRNLPLMYEVNGKAWINNHAHILKPRKGYDFDYAFIALESIDINPFITGSAQPKLNQENLKEIQIPIVDYDNQVKIARYLKEKCTEIDNLTADIQKQIDTLEQYKKSVITEAVTKGLNPDVEMKDSGVEWIGMIPKDWKVNRIKYLFKNGKGLSITKDNLIDSGLPVVSYGQIHSKDNSGVDIKKELYRYVDYGYQRLYPQCEVKKYDFIFADTSEDYDGCGNCVYKRDDETLFAGYHSIILHSYNQQDNRYFAYLFKTDCWRKQLREVASGVKLFSIAQKTLINASVLIPSFEEQQIIADCLDEKCSEIDSIISDKKKQLETLEQYKKSLIYEYVTGKKEVLV